MMMSPITPTRTAFAALAIGAVFALSTPAYATTTSLIVGDNLTSDGIGIGTITCTNAAGGAPPEACEGFTGGHTDADLDGIADGPGVLSGTDADLYSTPNSDPETELALVNNLAGESFTLADFTKIEMGDGILGDGDTDENASFTSNALYILFKFGAGALAGDTAVIKNTGLISFDVEYLKRAMGSGGLSHIALVGVIPLPAALMLMLTAVGGLAWVGRRRRAAGEA